MAMNFKQASVMVDYRDNLILAAALELDSLYKLCFKSTEVYQALPLLRDENALLRVLNEYAYRAIDRIVPNLIAVLVKEEMQESPIDLEELNRVLARPIGDALKAFKREKA
jgi:hypothetical protein